MRRHGSVIGVDYKKNVTHFCGSSQPQFPIGYMAFYSEAPGRAGRNLGFDTNLYALQTHSKFNQ